MFLGDQKILIFSFKSCAGHRRFCRLRVLGRLDYQPPFGKMSPHSFPRKSGWTSAISFVGLSQSCYRPQIFVWQRLSQKLTHRNRKSFLEETLGEILELSEGTQRFVRLFVVNFSFNDCCWRDFASSSIFSRRFRSR